MPVKYYDDEDESIDVEQSRADELRRVRYEEEVQMSEEEEQYLPYEQDDESVGAKAKKKNRIPVFTAVFMIAFALVIEGIQFGLIWAFGAGLAVNPIISFFAQTVIAVWFWWKGVSFKGTKVILTIAISFLIEVIPGLDILPGFLAEVIGVIIITKAEDGALGKLASVVPAGEKLAGGLEKINKLGKMIGGK